MSVPVPSAPTSLLSRRTWLLRASVASVAPMALSFAKPAHAGAQIEEPMIDSVRNALSTAIRSSAPPVPEFGDTASRLAYLRWLGEMSERLKKKVPGAQERIELLQTVWYESKRSGLDVSLVLGLIQVESNFRKWAVSSAGARGLMQVMPFWTRVIGDGDSAKLFHMRTNLRFGCQILRHYLNREGGNLFMTLGRYNGSRGRSPYPDAVFANQRLWAYKDRGDAPILPVTPAAG
ncbi:lytic transglycosylase domain-containing protein [Variovorax sp. PAMC 28711]|uniref:lytic transglycosylase domain-containing protein n=1 Tax=Variovorax sp. PAMC 28711 TaxID=1795631 RepID=UPI00078C4841|nr:lytic transglycosylase domain-containing protein [Variovorax sp. PAMC 28711]AMM23808.1 lytic transglycosylase [Variovorax sp. PAMC 28711]